MRQLTNRRRWCAPPGLIGAAFVLWATVLVSCGSESTPDEATEVCDEGARRVLLSEELTREAPSKPFEVAATGSTWVGLVADYDYSASALIPSLATVFVVSSGEPPDLQPPNDDPLVEFDGEGDFRPLVVVPGKYQVWSFRNPIITVVSCP